MYSQTRNKAPSMIVAKPQTNSQNEIEEDSLVMVGRLKESIRSQAAIQPKCVKHKAGTTKSVALGHSQTSCGIDSSNVYAMQPSDRHHSKQKIEQERRHQPFHHHQKKNTLLSWPIIEAPNDLYGDHVENITTFVTPKLNKAQSFCVPYSISSDGSKMCKLSSNYSIKL